MTMNKKGFTLVELLAVMVVLIIIILIALNAVRSNVDKTLDNTIRANAGMYIKTVNSFVSEQSITGSTYKNGFFTVSVLNDAGVKLSGTKPDSGYVFIQNSEVKQSCLKYEDYYINYKDGKMFDPDKTECSQFKIEYTFEYTGEVEPFVVPFDGKYILEVWGAQGGGIQNSEITELGTGGAGGYSKGEINLTKNTELFVYVGGEGTGSGSGFAKGGFNGGGSSWATNTGDPAGGGGGASDIRILADDLYYRVIVAGGGGGGGEDRETGYYGGGLTGGGSYGGTQTSTSGGAVFGLGAHTSYDGGGGGGGWFGGGTSGGSQTIPTSNSGNDAEGASGGSGYVFTSTASVVNNYGLDSTYYLTNTVIKGGNETMPTYDGSSNMTGNTGNGYAKITFTT